LQKSVSNLNLIISNSFCHYFILDLCTFRFNMNSYNCVCKALFGFFFNL
jgi:hypothetical protein